jgi:hypothetical protein
VRVRIEWIWDTRAKPNRVLASQSFSFERHETSWIQVVKQFLRSQGIPVPQSSYEKYKKALETFMQEHTQTWEQMEIDFPEVSEHVTGKFKEVEDEDTPEVERPTPKGTSKGL